MALSVFQNADQRTTEDKAALLNAIASAGTAGKQALQAGAADVAATRQGALDEAIRRFGDPGFAQAVPQAAQQTLLTSARQPGDAYAADNAQAQRLFAQDQARSASSAGRYMDQVKAAIPLVSARAEAAARDRAMERELRQAQMELEKERIAVEQEKLKNGGNSLDPFEALKKRYGVAGLPAVLDQAGDLVRSEAYTKAGGGHAAGFGAAGRLSHVPDEDHARRQAAEALGLNEADLAFVNGQRKLPKPSATKQPKAREQFTQRLVDYSTKHPKGQAPALLSTILDGYGKYTTDEGEEVPALPAARSAAEALQRLNQAVASGTIPKSFDPGWFREMIRLRYS